MRLSQAEKIFLGIIKIGLWIIPFLPLYVSSSMLFPFITGKNFTFRIIVEIIFAFWVGLAIARPEFRPRLTPLFKAVTIFIIVLFLADLFSPNPYRAFFSNYERMEGFMMFFHLYLYFVMLVSVFKTRRDWMIFFHLTLLASLWVSFIALMQKLGYRPSMQGGFRVEGTIGNPTYLAAYLMFHLWLLLILMYQFWRKWRLQVLYGAILIFELAILYFTATRGAVLAMVGTSFLLALAVVIFWTKIFLQTVSSLSVGEARPGGQSSRWPLGRKLAAAALILLIFIPLVLWQVRKTDFIQSSAVLGRLVNYSLEEKTIRSRFMIWNMSWQGFKEHPILGWGQENYYLVFQKYFNPRLYDQEPWFDRSHNIIFDWLINAGVFGLLSYLAIFGVVFWILYKGMRENIIPVWTGLVLTALFISYFGQNLFVFDNLNTYFLFFGFLAFSQFLQYREVEPLGGSTSKRLLREELAALEKRKSLAYAVVFMLLAVLSIAGYFLHLKPILEGRQLIATLRMLKTPGVTMEGVIDSFQKALSYNTFGDTETREQLAQLARDLTFNESVSAEDKKKMIEFAVEELKKEISHPAKDTKHMLFLGALMNSTLNLNPGYAIESERILKEAINLSPTKQIIYLELGQLYLLLGQKDKAADALRTAWQLEPDVQRLERTTADVWYYSILADMPELSAEIRKSTKLEHLGAENLERVGTAYRRVENFEAALDVYKILVWADPKNPKHRMTYAALLAYFGRMAEAREQAREAAHLDPANYATATEEFLE